MPDLEETEIQRVDKSEKRARLLDLIMSNLSMVLSEVFAVSLPIHIPT